MSSSVTSKVIDAAESTAPTDMGPALPRGGGAEAPGLDRSLRGDTPAALSPEMVGTHRRPAGTARPEPVDAPSPRRAIQPSVSSTQRPGDEKGDRLDHPSAWLRAVSFSTLSLDPEALGVARDPGACRGACRTAESAAAAEKEKLTAVSMSSASRPLLRLFDPETQRPVVLTFGTPEVLSVPRASSASKAFSTTDGARWLQDRGRSVFRILNIG